MSSKRTPVAIISGPVGVGKSAVGNELSAQLKQKLLPHTFVDFDQLRTTFPPPPHDIWGNKLGLKNLADLWANCADAGSLNLVLSYVVETEQFLQDILSIIPHAHIVLFQLSAHNETLEERIAQREIGSRLEWHKLRSKQLTKILNRNNTPCDFRIATDKRLVSDIAAEIAELVNWRFD